MRTAWQIGDQIQGRWEIFKILEGGAGVVYIVYDQVFREPFAAKTFKDEVFAQNPQVADRFMREALAWVRLDVHPNVAQARMVETIEGSPFLFLEYVSGGDLGSWIGTPRLTEDLPQVLRFAIQFCDGITHALSKGIRAHRDIKPRNCLITADGVLKVTDFGLAKLLEECASTETSKAAGGNTVVNMTQAAVGTCTHMAPEQFANNEHIDVRADIYSFGVMLYQMIKGELPFSGESWQELEHLHSSQPAPALKDTDRRLAEVVEKCLLKDPARRFQDFVQVRRRLADIYQEITGSAPPEPAQGKELNEIQLNNKGSSLNHLGRHTEAIACYDAALQLNPLQAHTWFNRGVALFALKKVDEALACYERSIVLNAKSERAWSNRGVALKSVGRTPEAIRCYERALELNPRYPNAWINKGVAFRSLGQPAEALKCYERALRLDPNDWSGWSNKGNVHYASGAAAQAVACYDRALELNPNLDLTWLNKGIALAALGQNVEALHCYADAIRLNPSLAQAWFLHGVTLLNVFQNPRGALPYFEQAERLGHEDAAKALALCKSAAGTPQHAH